MKKLLTALITAIMLLCLAFAVGCGEEKWQNPTLLISESVISQDGFIAETENYLFYINGVASNTEDNAFGKPIKGSLMAVAKSEIGKENPSTEIIVPKMFLASDAGAGLFFHEGYVYYGSPCTDKNSSGAIAREKMTFLRSAVASGDIKGSTETYLTVDALYTEYRFTVIDNVVYIVYYDTANTALMAYNTATKTQETLCKTDAEVSGVGSESLASYKFLDGNGGAVVAYTTTVYAEEYYEEKASLAGYSRATEQYNNLYLYGEGGKEKLFGGAEDKLIYSLTHASGEHIFFTESTVLGDVSNKAISVNAKATKIEITKADALVASTHIVSLTEAYYMDTENNAIYKTTLTGSDFTRELIYKGDRVSSILKIENGVLYYISSENYVCRMNLTDGEDKEVKLSGGTIDVTWFNPEFVKITSGDNAGDYLFYADSTTLGAKYVHVINLANEEKSETKDDVTTYYIEGAKLLGKQTEMDKANETKDAIEKIEAVLEHEIVDGKFTVKSYENAKTLYEALKKENKKVAEAIPAELLTKLENVEKAVKLGELYYNLKGVKADNKGEYTEAYEQAKKYRAELLEVSEENYATTRDMLKEQLKYYYQEAAKIMEVAED